MGRYDFGGEHARRPYREMIPLATIEKKQEPYFQMGS